MRFWFSGTVGRSSFGLAFSQLFFSGAFNVCKGRRLFALCVSRCGRLNYRSSLRVWVALSPLSAIFNIPAPECVRTRALCTLAHLSLFFFFGFPSDFSCFQFLDSELEFLKFPLGGYVRTTHPTPEHAHPNNKYRPYCSPTSIALTKEQK